MKQKKYNTRSQKHKSRDIFDDVDLDIIDDYLQPTQEDIAIDNDTDTYSSLVEEDDLEEDTDEILEEDTDIHKQEEYNIVVPEIEVKNISLPKKRGPKPNKIEFYVEPKEFDKKILDFYENNIITDELATMISKIANKLSYAPNFINYTYRDEMVGDAIVRMMKALISKKYTHSKGKNPFSYFTKIAFNAFRNRIKKEKYMHDALQKYQEEIHMHGEYTSCIKNKRKYNIDDLTTQDE